MAVVKFSLGVISFFFLFLKNSHSISENIRLEDNGVSSKYFQSPSASNFINRLQLKEDSDYSNSVANEPDRREIENEILSLEKIFDDIAKYEQLTNMEERSQDNDSIAKRGNGKANGAMTKLQKDEILKAHNDARRQVRPSAANMKLMKWDNKLERVAKNYVKKCINGHNDNRKEEAGRRFKSVGENIYWSSGKKTNPTGAVNSFDKEKHWYNYYTSKCNLGKQCGHYVQDPVAVCTAIHKNTHALCRVELVKKFPARGLTVVWAETTKVGCASWLCPVGIKIVCNYAPASNMWKKPYVIGSKCSKCPPGTRCLEGMCT